MKRTRLLILSVLLIATLIPVSVYAENTTSSPDVTVFATKEQMMDGTFAPNDQGEPQKIGRITFGKTYSGLSNNIWYILGQDKGIKDDDGKLIDNTVIFSNNAIADDQLFNSKTNDEPNEVDYKYTKENANVYKDIDADNDGIVSVYVNHYGASELHNDLTNMASNLTMFSETEQKLMNETTIKTMDIKNGFLYETKDKLYAMTSDYPNSQIIKLGSSDQIKINTLKYFEFSGLNFWLRSPIDDTGVLFAENFRKATLTSADSTDPWKIFVLPASNLNLTNVLFASAAKAGSTDIIESDTVMKLRLNGKDKNIGEVYYDEDAKKIIVSKGTVENKVHLIVQGKGSSPYYKQNWYYSKEITGTETIKASDIKQALGLSSDPSLANSKIWLETSDTDGLIYAVEAKEVKAISNIEISIDAPVANKPLATSFTCTDGLNTDSISWKPKETTAGYNKTYEASMTLSIKVGYRLADTVSATVNGEKATSVTKNDDGTLTVTYTFPCTQDRVISVTNPDTLTFKNGTSLESIFNSLPTKVTVTTESQKEIELPISWYKDPQLIYDQSDKGKQEFDIVGPVTLDDTFVRDDAVPTATIKVIVKAAEAPSSGNGSNHTVIIPDTSVK
ncbi:MAG: hypothetical protein PUC68_06095 [Firmicutes bacterium]|nr:hypothetical protein [Bacillota bacterium]